MSWEMTVEAEAATETAISPATGRTLYRTPLGWSSEAPLVPAILAPAPGRIARGSEQQEAFWAELLEGSGHVLLEARAGTGKSTSCREGMHRILARRPDAAIRYCCFNRKIAEEFAERCPDGVDVGTMHRFGFQALQQAFGSRLDEAKTYTLLDQTPDARMLKRYVRKSIAVLVGHAKNAGLAPDDPELPAHLADFAARYDVPTWRQQALIFGYAAEILARAAEVRAIVDFDDMLWLPVLLDEIRFPAVDYLFIDECQDLNGVQHLLAGRLAGSGRTVVVGDPYQSIYAFRGADTDSIPRLRERLGAKTMPLTVTWRCPRSHVELARRLVPDFEAAPEAAEGVLSERGPGCLDDVRPGDLVLCRTNAPIIRECLQQIARFRPAIVRGRAIGKQLAGIAARVIDGGAATMADFTRGLGRWRSAEIERLEARDGTESLIEAVEDQASALDAIASACSGPGEIAGAIGRLFDDADAADRVTYSSVHRAKGSEARRVTYLQVPYGLRRDRERPPQQWELDQRRNLRYVALTRSLDTLTLTVPRS
jgi:DNA helicase-2/ATP-dependent DNA helicase PcrA